MIEKLRARGYEVILARSAADAVAAIQSDPLTGCVIVDADLDRLRRRRDRIARVSRAQRPHTRLPIRQRSQIPAIPLSMLKLADEFVWLTEDTPTFIAGRVEAAIRRYRENLLPPMFSSMLAQANMREYAFGTPGHLGGTAFLKTPVSKVFFDYFGENLFRSDLSIGMAAVGSLLDHSGPIGESEKYAARVFGAHRSYTVTNGTSSSNRIIFMASLTRGDVALCDRNCHKSIEHGLIMSRATPVYLVPHRNRYGIIGPIYPEDLQPETIRARFDAHPLDRRRHRAQAAAHGHHELDLRRVDLQRSTRDRDRRGRDRPPALRRGLVRLRAVQPALPEPPRDVRRRRRVQGRPDVVRDTFDAQAARGALAGVVHSHSRRARSDRACALQRVVHDACLDLAVLSDHRLERDLRRDDGRRERRSVDHRGDPRGGELSTDDRPHQAAVRGGRRLVLRHLERDARSPIPRRSSAWRSKTRPKTLLVSDPNCWVLHPSETWHGFDGLEDGYCMLDPIKVTVVSPGIATDGSFEKRGIPAALISAYLVRHGFEYEKTQDFTILFLFSIGMTKAKWGTLLTTLIKFKEDYDANTPLERRPAGPRRCRAGALRRNGTARLSDEMFDQYQRSNQMQPSAGRFLEPARARDDPRRTPTGVSCATRSSA